MPIKAKEKELKLFKIFKRAVMAEREAQEMYKEAIAVCGDPALTIVLQNFCDDELKHENEIVRHYNTLKHESRI